MMNYWTTINGYIIVGTYPQLTRVVNKINIVGSEFHKIPSL